jgi:hypothetical protein
MPGTDRVIAFSQLVVKGLKTALKALARRNFPSLSSISFVTPLFLRNS